MRRLPPLLIAILLLMLAVPAQAAPLAADTCFQQVPNCISGRFAQYWRDNGGLAVFGLPLSASSKQRTGEGPTTYLVQYFERARFELHPKEPKPYDVLLSRLGVDELAAQGRDWQTSAKADPSAPHYFAETGHAITGQFWGFWSSHGLEFDGNKKAKSFGEALALFGMPVSEPQMEPSSDGNSYLTQWFERARFEFHPENQPPYDVLLGLLGAAAYQRAPAATGPAPAPGLPGIPTPSGNCATNAPPAYEGAQAWMTDPEPQAPNSNNSLCARLIVNGQVVSGAELTAAAHYKNSNDNLGPVATNAEGVGEIGFNIGTADRHFVVTVDVTLKANGQVYTTETDFNPDYPLKGQAPKSGPVVPNIPTPSGACIANAPPAYEGAQAWMTVIRPSDPNQIFDSICARLIVNGQVVSGAVVNASAKYRKFARDYGPATTGADGVAEIGFNIADTQRHYLVFVTVSIKAPDGQMYEATTYFRPDFPQE